MVLKGCSNIAETSRPQTYRNLTWPTNDISVAILGKSGNRGGCLECNYSTDSYCGLVWPPLHVQLEWDYYWINLGKLLIICIIPKPGCFLEGFPDPKPPFWGTGRYNLARIILKNPCLAWIFGCHLHVPAMDQLFFGGLMLPVEPTFLPANWSPFHGIFGRIFWPRKSNWLGDWKTQ